MTERVNWKGFEACILRNAILEVVVVPELGAKVISIKNRVTGREWMYHPNESLDLFQNQPHDAFAESTMVGWDECLPTISPCTWRGRSLPDHGETWAAQWHLDEAAWRAGVIKTSLQLPISPFRFTREIKMQNDTLRVDYQLENLSGESQEFLWAMHPLLALKAGDQLVLSREMRKSIGHLSWLDSLHFEGNTPSSAKVFARPVQHGQAEILNPGSGDSLIFNWDAAECNTLGIWLTRGGWHGHHHLALEPSNGASDSLAEAAVKGNNCGVLPPFAQKHWAIQMRVTHVPPSPLQAQSVTAPEWSKAAI